MESGLNDNKRLKPASEFLDQYYKSLGDGTIPPEIEDLNSVKIMHHRRVWRPFMEKYGIRKIAEVGVFRGENFFFMIEHRPDVAVAVDAWSAGPSVANDARLSQECLDEQYECFRAVTAHNPNVRIIRDFTDKAAKEFPDGYFDLIYIDGDHSREGCLKDMDAWYPKLRTGGVFVGDDYDKRGVVYGTRKFQEICFDPINIHPITNRGWAIIKP